MGELIVVTGPPGAGKSAVATVLADVLDPSALVPGDAFFAFLRRGAVAPWRPDSHEQNTVVVQAAAAAAGRLTAGRDVVYDGVLGPWFVPTFLARTGLARIHVAVLLPPVEVCLARVAARRDHVFTDADATRFMHRQFREAGIEPRHVLPNSTLPVAAAVAEIRVRVRAGTIAVP